MLNQFTNEEIECLRGHINSINKIIDGKLGLLKKKKLRETKESRKEYYANRLRSGVRATKPAHLKKIR